MRIVLIAAVADNGVIGRHNAMPWRLKSDLQRFRALTTGKPLIMGRRTYESLGRPLPLRTNVVLSRDRHFSAPGILIAPTIENALAIARADALRRGAAEIMAVGGSHVYAALMPLASELQITRVHASPEGDTFFPPIDPGVWAESERSEHAPAAEDSAPFGWVTYRRTMPLPRQS
jgi:dihydrofolate reductase